MNNGHFSSSNTYKSYFQREGQKQTILFMAGIHGAEAESVCAGARRIAVLEDITDTTKISDLWGKTDTVKRIANHHASFYFAELGRILEGNPSPHVQMMVPQDKVNVEWKVVDAGVWWDVLDVREGWKLERHILTKHCRILSPEKKRIAWGDERSMRESFEKVKKQLSGE